MPPSRHITHRELLPWVVDLFNTTLAVASESLLIYLRTLLDLFRPSSTLRLFGARQPAVLRLQDASRAAVKLAQFSSDQLDGLPPPVQRYLQKVLPDGTPRIRWAQSAQHTLLRLNASPDGSEAEKAGWRKTRASSFVCPPLLQYVWPARCWMGPLMWVNGQDALIDGHGACTWRLWGLLPVVNVSCSPPLDVGAALRLLAEAPLYPTLLLPGEGVTWEPVDDASARATLTLPNGTTCSGVFTFNAQDEAVRFWTDGRPRALPKGGFSMDPWVGEWSEYRPVDGSGGVLAPTCGQVAWLLGGQRVTYCKLKLEGMTYST